MTTDTQLEFDALSEDKKAFFHPLPGNAARIRRARDGEVTFDGFTLTPQYFVALDVSGMVCISARSVETLKVFVRYQGGESVWLH